MTTPGSPTLDQRQFAAIGSLVYQRCGINLVAGKEPLVRSRLHKRLRALGLQGFDDYVALLERDTSGQELDFMVDVLTTNKTSFFREAQHFDYLADQLIPQWAAQTGPLRLWSAGCSTGEEPYSIAMTLCRHLPDARRRQTQVLATDISPTVLATARGGAYPAETLRSVPEALAGTYFTRMDGQGAAAFRVNDEPRALVRFARLNLTSAWPMKGPFDAIFCRNVMIYFDRPTRETLVNRFCALLRPGACLFVGHSESLTGLETPLTYVQPAVYRRPSLT